MIDFKVVTAPSLRQMLYTGGMTTRRKLLNRRTRQNIILALSSILISLLLAELLIRATDPIGLYRYFNELSRLNSYAIPSASGGFTYREGTIDQGTWVAHIDAAGNRVTPHSDTTASCPIATIGDSVTFGFGVNDDQAWPDLLATELHVNVVNPAKPKYNAGNFASLVKATPADAYIYLAIDNDADPPGTYQPADQAIAPELALQDYLFYALRSRRTSERAPDVSHYVAEMGDVLTMRNLLIVTFEGNAFNTELQRARSDTVVIPRWTEVISKGDPHPNAVGQQQIADMLMPSVRAWLPTVCKQGVGYDD